MLIPKKNRREVYKFLFNEGVLYAEKDFNLPKHPELDVPNLQVIKLMQSFKSRELVTERFAWRHYYWFLTDTGIDFLREYLNLPAEVGQCAPFHRHHALALLCMNACVTDPLAGKELSCIGNTALFGASDSMLQKFYQL